MLAGLASSACEREVKEQWAISLTGGDPARGKQAISNYGCVSCHSVPGVGEEATAAPPLERMARRMWVAGMLENKPENLIRWIQKPREVNPHTAMPDMKVKDGDARDIAAYLYTLD